MAGMSLALSNIGSMMLLKQDCCSLSGVDTFSGTATSGFAGILMAGARCNYPEAPKMAFSHHLEFIKVPNSNLLFA